MFKFLEFTVDEYFLLSPITWKENADFLKLDKGKRKGWEFIKECNDGRKRLTARYKYGSMFGAFIHINFVEDKELLMYGDITVNSTSGHNEYSLFNRINYEYYLKNYGKEKVKYRLNNRIQSSSVICCSDTMNSLKKFIENLIINFKTVKEYEGGTIDITVVRNDFNRNCTRYLKDLSCF